jgi:DNA polymerase-4
MFTGKHYDDETVGVSHAFWLPSRAMILHVDMDAFYASIEQRDRPELRGKPVVVGGSADGRGVVAAASYEARRFGVHSAMPAASARRLCPCAVFLRPRMEHYAAVSAQILELFGRYTPLVEPLSLDEAFLDVSGSQGLFGSACAIAQKIKHDIRQCVALVASVGIAPNKFLAKIASDLEKPDGLVEVPADRVMEFLEPLPVSRLWGVGRVTNRKFEKLGIRTVGQLRQLSEDILRDHFGHAGEHLWQLAHGIDPRRVVPDVEAKSISHEKTFAQDIEEVDVLRAWLLELTEQVACRLRRHGLRGRTVHLKVRYDDFHTITRAHTFTRGTNLTQELWSAIVQMLSRRMPDRRLRIRLLGVGVSGLETGKGIQKDLFVDIEQEKQSRLDNAMDSIKAKFGSAALKRALGMAHKIDNPFGSDRRRDDQYGE